MRASHVLLVIATAGIHVACSRSSSGDQESGPYEWVARDPLPIPRTELGVVAIGGKVYAIGGSSGSTLARVDEYDTATGKWTRKADMHTPRRSFAVAAIDGKIYVGPGLIWTSVASVTYTFDTEVYDPATDAWTQLAPCPSIAPANGGWGNMFFGGGAVNGRLYVVIVTYAGNLTYEYDPSTNAWRTRAPSPLPPFSEFAATAFGGQVWAYASSDFPGRGIVASYDPVEDFWITRPGLPGYTHPALVASNGKLYAMGGLAWGNTRTTSSSAVHEFDPATGRWSERGSFLTARQDAGAADVGGHLFVVGGDVWSGGTIHDGAPTAAVEEGIPR